MTKFNQLTIPSVSKDMKQSNLWQECKFEQHIAKLWYYLLNLNVCSPND